MSTTITKVPRAGGKHAYKVRVRTDDHRTFSKTFQTKKAAQTWAGRMNSDADLARAESNPLLRQLTVGELIAEYLDQHTGKDPAIHGRLNWWHREIGTLPVGKLTKQRLRPILKTYASGHALRGDGKHFDNGKLANRIKETDRTRSGSTVNRMRAALEGVLKFGRDNLDLNVDPFKDLPREKEGKPRTRFLSDKERATLLSVCRESDWDRLWLLVAMAVTSGARQSELLNLHWNDIDWQGHRAALHDTKNNESRNIHLVDLVLNELRLFREIGGGVLVHRIFVFAYLIIAL